MRRRWISSPGVLALTAMLTLLLAASEGWAQRGVGVRLGGVYHGYYPSVYRYNYNHYYGYNHPWRYTYGYYPYWGVGGFPVVNQVYPSSYVGSPYAMPVPAPMVYSAPAPTYSAPSADYQAFYPPNYAQSVVATLPGTNPPNPPNTAAITVRVPPDAEVWFEGQKMTRTGTVRNFVSPPLTPGQSYVYDVKARWMQDGREVTQERQVNVKAGEQVMVDFIAEK